MVCILISISRTFRFVSAKCDHHYRCLAYNVAEAPVSTATFTRVSPPTMTLLMIIYYYYTISRLCCIVAAERSVPSPSEERYLVVLVEAGVVTAETHHELVHHLEVYAALVPLDEEMMVGAVRRRAVHLVRVQVDRTHVGRGADLEPVQPFFDHPAHATNGTR